MMTYEETCRQIASEIKSLSTEELKSKITSWLLNPELEHYAHVLQKELELRNSL